MGIVWWLEDVESALNSQGNSNWPRHWWIHWQFWSWQSPWRTWNYARYVWGSGCPLCYFRWVPLRLGAHQTWNYGSHLNIWGWCWWHHQRIRRRDRWRDPRDLSEGFLNCFRCYHWHWREWVTRGSVHWSRGLRWWHQQLDRPGELGHHLWRHQTRSWGCLCHD